MGGKTLTKTSSLMYDFYRSMKEPDERMATLQGAGLPGHVDPNDWDLISSPKLEIHVDVDEDIEARGFSYFKLVER
jgi:hypothetical protein